MMVFRWHEDVQCVHWIPPPNTGIHVPTRLVENKPEQSARCAVGRMRRRMDIYSAHIRIDGKGHAVVDGGLLSGMDYDVLSQSSDCVFA